MWKPKTQRYRSDGVRMKRIVQHGLQPSVEYTTKGFRVFTGLSLTQ